MPRTKMFELEMRRRCPILAAASGLALLVLPALTPPGLSAAMTLSECGVTVPAGETAALSSNLDCAVDPAVILKSDATLHLGGFRLGALAGAGTGVSCEKSCTVDGPGELGGFTIGLKSPKHVFVSDVEFRGGQSGIWSNSALIERSGFFGHSFDHSAWAVRSFVAEIRGCVFENNDVGVYGQRLTLEQSTIIGSKWAAITLVNSADDPDYGVMGARIYDSIIRDNGYGVSVSWAVNYSFGPSGSIRMERSTVVGNGGRGLDAFRVFVKDSEIRSNRSGIETNSLHITDSVVSGNEQRGVHAREARRGRFGNRSVFGKVKMVNTVIEANGEDGVESHRVRAKQSTISGNGTSVDCLDCADLVSYWRPKLAMSSCLRSRKLGDPSLNWETCALD